MKRNFSRYIIVFMIVGGIVLLGAAARWLLVDETSPYSKYDETYVTQSEAIALGNIDVDEVQSKSADYAGTCKSIDNLIEVTFYLNKAHDLTRVRFSYNLSDVENYCGFLEIICDKSDSNWEIQSAKSEYNYGDNIYSPGYKSITDANLENKIEAITEYISSAGKGDFDIYRIELSEDRAKINAYNDETSTDTENWTEYCKIINGNGEIGIVKENQW